MHAQCCGHSMQACGCDPYYSAIHAYSAQIAQSAQQEILKQSEDLRNFRKVMLAQELDNEKLKSISSKLHGEILRLSEDKNKMKNYMDTLEKKNKELQDSLDVTSEELLTKESRNTEDIRRMNEELMKLHEEKNSLQEKFLKLELEYLNQQKDAEMLIAEKLKAEKSIKHLESSNELQTAENEKLRIRLKKEREARILLEDWEKKRLQRLALFDPMNRLAPPLYPIYAPPAGTIPRRPPQASMPMPVPGLTSVPSADILTKLKLLESELHSEAEAARNRSNKIAQGWGSPSNNNTGRKAASHTAGSSKHQYDY